MWKNRLGVQKVRFDLFCNHAPIHERHHILDHDNLEVIDRVRRNALNCVETIVDDLQVVLGLWQFFLANVDELEVIRNN